MGDAVEECPAQLITSTLEQLLRCIAHLYRNNMDIIFMIIMYNDDSSLHNNNNYSINSRDAASAKFSIIALVYA